MQLSLKIDDTFGTCPCNMCVEHMKKKYNTCNLEHETTCNIRLKQLKHFGTYYCNICVKHIQHSDKKMIAPYVWKQMKYFQQTLVTCILNTCNMCNIPRFVTS
jgi:outer membrane receptor for monomeric catechols